MKKIFTFAAMCIAAMTLNAQIVKTCDEAYDEAKALNAGDTLTVDGAVAIVEVTGYVTNGGNGTITNGQQTFYIGKDANETVKTLQAYKCNIPENEAAVNKGDKVKITGKLMHYVNASGTTDVAELINASAEILDRVVVRTDTIDDLSVCEIIEEGESLNGGPYSSDFFEITAVVDSLTFTNASKMQQTFFFYCLENGKTLQAYNANMQDTLCEVGDTVKVLGKITLYAAKNQVEFEGPKAWVVGKQAPKTIEEVTVAQAIEIGQALGQGSATKEKYTIIGYVDSIAVAYSEQYNNISFFMTDDMAEPTYNFQAYRVGCTAAQAAMIFVGRKVAVTATIKNFHKDATDTEEEVNLIEADGGILEIIPGEGIINVSNSEQAIKRIENGQVIILRNGVRYNALGAEVK